MTIDGGGSVTRWIDEIRAGDLDDASRGLWGRYFEQLARLARHRLRSARRGLADEEDVALSVLDSVFEGISAGVYPRLGDRDDLWRLLVTIAARKAANLLRREHQLKRGGGRVLGEAAFDGTTPDARRALAEVVGSEPTPEFAAMVAEECRIRLEGLKDDSLRQVAVMRMEGHANEEIAARLDISLRSVERKLEAIRKRWQPEEES